MSNQLTIVHADEASRWGADPYAEMVAAVKERQARQRAQEAAAQAAINADIEAQKRRELNTALTQANLVLEAKARRRAEKQAAMNALVAAAMAAHPDLYNPEAKIIHTPVTLARRIITIVAREYGVSFSDVYSKARVRPIVHARQLSVYEVKRYLKWSFPATGRFFGGLDHSTACHAVERVMERMEKDSFREFVERIELKIDTI